MSGAALLSFEEGSWPTQVVAANELAGVQRSFARRRWGNRQVGRLFHEAAYPCLMRLPIFALACLALLLAVSFAGCLDRITDQMEDPYGFDGALQAGNAPERSKEIQEALDGFDLLTVNVQQQNNDAVYQVIVDGEGNCREARELVGELEFIRTRSACAPVER